MYKPGLGGGAKAAEFYRRKYQQYVYPPRGVKRKKYIPRNITSESKYFDAESNNFAIPANTAWAATNDVMKGTICLPVEGSDIDNRVGRKINVYKVSLRGIISVTASSDNVDIIAAPAYRIILWMDQQTNAAVTTAASLMANSTTAESDNLFCTFQNPANFGRFRVLKDEIIESRDITAATDGANTSSQRFATICFKLTHKFKNAQQVRFNATNGGTIADVIDTSFYFSIQANNAAFTQTVTTLSRVYYKDS